MVLPEHACTPLVQQQLCTCERLMLAVHVCRLFLQFAFVTVDAAAPENLNPEPTPEVSPGREGAWAVAAAAKQPELLTSTRLSLSSSTCVGRSAGQHTCATAEPCSHA